MYGKIIDGKLVLAPNPLITWRYKIYNPRPEDYIEEGYKEIVETEYPTDGKYYDSSYVDRNGKIYREWVEAETPEVTEPTLTTDERITALEERTDDLGEALNMILEGVTE